MAKQSNRLGLTEVLPAGAIIDPETLPVAGERWDWAIAYLLGALLLFMPAAFGAVEGWSGLIVVLAAAALSLCLAARVAFDPDFRIARTWIYLPLGLFLLLAALQFAPLSASLVRTLAPSNLAIKEELLGETFNPSQLTSLSFYPRDTAQQLRIVLVATAVFVTVASVFRRAQQIKILLAVIFVIGSAEGILAVAQIVTGSGSIYWSFLLKTGVTTAGTFVNYSNFAQFMNLSLGAGLALLLIRIEEQRRNAHHGGGWGWTARSYWEKNAWLCAGIIICALSIFASMSRNGAISMIIAAAVLAALLFQRGSLSWRGWLVAALPAGVLAILLIFGFDIVYNRLVTLHESEAFNLRWEMTAAAYRAWQRYPLWGTGLGTHEVVAPLFEASVTTVVAGHADNDYAQLLEETGAVGSTMVACILLGIAVLALKGVFRGRKPASMANFGLLFGLIAVAIQSVSDFGQRIPANLSLTAALCGLVVATSRMESSPKNRHGAGGPRRRFSGWPRIAAAAMAFVFLLVAWGWAARGAYSAHLGERWWAAAETFDNRIKKIGRGNRRRLYRFNRGCSGCF